MSSTLVLAYFEEDSEEANTFDTVMDFISSSFEGLGEYSDEGLSEMLQNQPDEVRDSTKKLISNEWFWRFDPEIGWGMFDEEDEEEEGLTVLQVDFLIDKDSEKMKEIVSWMNTCGAKKVELREGEFDDDDEFEILL